MNSPLSDPALTAIVRTGRVEFSRPLAQSVVAPACAEHTFARPVVRPVPRRLADGLAGRSTW